MNQITVYITKYALTKGIYEIVAVQGESHPESIQQKTLPGEMSICLHEGQDWHRTYSSACNRAKQMRDEKIDSLSKQIAKLEKMKF